MTQNRGTLVILVLFFAWLVLVALSVLVPMNTAPTDMGFTRGLNRVSIFFQFQIAAAVLALLIWAVSRGAQRRALRWLGRVPGLFALLLIAGILALFLWANFAKPGQTPPPPDRPVTAPVDG